MVGRWEAVYKSNMSSMIPIIYLAANLTNLQLVLHGVAGEAPIILSLT